MDNVTCVLRISEKGTTKGQLGHSFIQSLSELLWEQYHTQATINGYYKWTWGSLKLKLTLYASFNIVIGENGRKERERG